MTENADATRELVAEGDAADLCPELEALVLAGGIPCPQGLWTDLMERLHTAAGPMHDPSECAPDEGFPGLCSACRTALGNRVQAVAPGVLAPPRAGQPGWATAKALLVLLRGVEAFGLLARETVSSPPAAPQEGGAHG